MSQFASKDSNEAALYRASKERGIRRCSIDAFAHEYQNAKEGFASKTQQHRTSPIRELLLIATARDDRQSRTTQAPKEVQDLSTSYRLVSSIKIAPQNKTKVSPPLH